MIDPRRAAPITVAASVERRVPSPALVSGTAIALCAVAFWFRVAAFKGFPNDHFMHVAWAQQILAGAWPGRDFVEPGMPLTIALSALAQIVWPGALSELALTSFLFALAVALTFVAAVRMTDSIVAGGAAAFAVMLADPRLYGYPKVLVPVLMLWLVGRWAQRRSSGRLWGIAAGVAVSFLLRHDLGAIAAAAFAVAALAETSQPVSTRVMTLFGAAWRTLVVLAPYLIFVQATEGVAEHVRVGLEFGKSDEHQLLWELTPPDAGDGDPRVVFGQWSVTTIHFLYWFYTAQMLAVTVVALRRVGHPDAALWAALCVLLVVYRLVVVRHPLGARLPDVASVLGVGGAAIGSIVARQVKVWWRASRRALAVAAAGAALVVLEVVTISLSSFDNLADRFDQAGVSRGIGGMAASVEELMERGGTWRGEWPAGPVPPVVDYLSRCARPGDRLMITWFAPEYFVVAGQPFASGHSQFFPAASSFATSRDQALMLRRLQKENVPVVLINETEHERFTLALPEVADYLARNYTIRTRYNRDNDTVIGVAVRNDINPVTTFEDPPWACGYH